LQVKAKRKPARRKGPPPWSNAASLRDADGKIARSMPPGVKAMIDQLPLSSSKKSKLKGSPVSFLVGLAQSDPKSVSDYINSVRQQGANVQAPKAGENPASLAVKLVAAASTKPSAAVKGAAEQAMAGMLGALATTTRASFSALAPALASIAPITLPALKSLALSKPVMMPSKKAVADAMNAANTGAAMMNATSPEATAAATAAANEEDKILGLPPMVVYGGGGLLVVLGLMRVLKKK
jgi:hypothetical protein